MVECRGMIDGLQAYTTQQANDMLVRNKRTRNMKKRLDCIYGTNFIQLHRHCAWLDRYAHNRQPDRQTACCTCRWPFSNAKLYLATNVYGSEKNCFPQSTDISRSQPVSIAFCSCPKFLYEPPYPTAIYGVPSYILRTFSYNMNTPHLVDDSFPVSASLSADVEVSFALLLRFRMPP